MSSRAILIRMPGSTDRRHCNCDQASPSAPLLNVISRPSTLASETMMAMNEMKADEEDFQIAGEAEEAVEERKKTTKKMKMVIIGAKLCKCPRSPMGKAGCSDKQQEDVTAMLPERSQETPPPEWT